MGKVIFAVMAGIVLSAATAMAFFSGGYTYISAEDLQKRLKERDSMILVDICSAEQFAGGHIAGSIETNAYPVKSDVERGYLEKLVPGILASGDDVIVICPGGGGGAKRTVDFYKSKGVAGERLLILEKGMDAWPYEKEAK
jgi:rhodanese-related sulfurtransferase